MSIRFSGINIHAKDPVESFEFYKGLGLTVKEEASDPDSKWYGATFSIGDATLWIWRDNSGETAENQGRMTVQIVINLDNIEQTYRDLKAKGYAVSEIETMFYGGREMNLTDPDGNRILFLD